MLIRANHQDGYMLIVILILIHLFALFSLWQWEMVRQEILFVKEKWQVINDQHLLESLIGKIEKELANHKKSCMISVLSSEALKNQPLNTWCHLNIERHVYLYVVEKLMQDNCAMLSKNRQGMTYYRISIRKEFSSIIQVITTIHEKNQFPCESSIRKKKIGRQSLREL